MTVYELRKAELPRNARSSIRIIPGQVWGVWLEQGGFEKYRVLRLYIDIDRLRIALIRLCDEHLCNYSDKYFREWFYHESDFLRLENEEMTKEVKSREIKKWRRAFNTVLRQEVN